MRVVSDHRRYESGVAHLAIHRWFFEESKFKAPKSVPPFLGCARVTSDGLIPTEVIRACLVFSWCHVFAIGSKLTVRADGKYMAPGDRITLTDMDTDEQIGSS
jgi:hypothetical protein